MKKIFSIAVAVLLGFNAFAWADQPEELTPEAQAAAEELKASLPKDSEARAMLDQILDGGRMGPGEGWFRLAVSQTRFGWDSLEKTYDADHDQRISRKEFHGTPADFSRLDRDQNRFLDKADFDWSRHSLARTPGVLMFFQADKNANGQVTPEEFQTLFRTLDRGGKGYLSLDELRDEFQPLTEEQTLTQRAQRTGGPSPSTLVLGLKKQEIGSLQPGPKLNDPAPDFTLASLGGREVTLSKEIGPKPIVLIFGNFSCSPFRSQSGNLEKLYERYKDRAKFFLVYVREAHPSDGWRSSNNDRVGIKFPQPQSTKARRDVAQTCQKHLSLQIPFLVDTIEDSVGSVYSGMPNRLYLIDQNGKIAFKNGRGPFGFHPRELEQALVLLLNQSAKTDAKTK